MESARHCQDSCPWLLQEMVTETSSPTTTATASSGRTSASSNSSTPITPPATRSASIPKPATPPPHPPLRRRPHDPPNPHRPRRPQRLVSPSHSRPRKIQRGEDSRPPPRIHRADLAARKSSMAHNASCSRVKSCWIDGSPSGMVSSEWKNLLKTFFGLPQGAKTPGRISGQLCRGSVGSRTLCALSSEHTLRGTV